MRRAPLNSDELRAMALAKSSLLPPTICVKNACRAVTSKVLTTPRNPPRAMRCQTWMIPENASQASTNA